MATSRLAAGALLIGSAGLICMFVVGTTTGADAPGSSLAVPIKLIEAIAAIVALLGFPAMLIGHPRRGRGLTVAGYAGIFAITAYVNVFIGFTMALVLPWVAAQGVSVGRGPQVIGMTFVVLAIAQVIFTGLLAAGALRAGRRAPGWILVASTVVAAASVMPVPDFVVTGAAVLLYLGIGSLAAGALARTVPTGAMSLDA